MSHVLQSPQSTYQAPHIEGMGNMDIRINAIVGNELELLLGVLEVDLAHESREREPVDNRRLVLHLDRASKCHHQELERRLQVLWLFGYKAVFADMIRKSVCTEWRRPFDPAFHDPICPEKDSIVVYPTLGVLLDSLDQFVP